MPGIVKALEAHIVGSQLAAGVELPGHGGTCFPLPGFRENRPPGAATPGRPEADPPVRGSGSFVRGNMGLPPHSRIGFFYFESLNHEIPSLNSILCRNSRSLLRQVLEDAGLSVEFHSE